MATDYLGWIQLWFSRTVEPEETEEEDKQLTLQWEEEELQQAVETQ